MYIDIVCGIWDRDKFQSQSVPGQTQTLDVSLIVVVLPSFCNLFEVVDLVSVDFYVPCLHQFTLESTCKFVAGVPEKPQSVCVLSHMAW